MYGTAVNLAILALGSAACLVLLVIQTISTEHETPPKATLAFMSFAVAMFTIGAAGTALMAKRAENRRARELKHRNRPLPVD